MATDPIIPFPYLPTGNTDPAKTGANFDQLLKYIRDRNDGTVAWDALVVTGSSTFNTAITITPTTNQIILGTTRTVTLTAPTPASASRIYTFPDLSGAYSVVGTIGTQTISGTKTFDGQLIGKGTATNDDAAAGYIGEYMSSANGAKTNFPASNNYGDATSLSLTAGDWDIDAIVYATVNTATWTQVLMGISTTSGNNGTGLSDGDNELVGQWASSSTTPVVVPFTVSNYRVKLTSTTTHYLKVRSTYSAGQPQYSYRMSARRRR